MPAKEIMSNYKAGTLHSGKGGPIVKNPKQAEAIKMSYLRKEGKIPATGMAAQLNSMKQKGILKKSK